MKRFAVAFLTLFSFLAIPVASFSAPHMEWKAMRFRSTSAASVARQANWAYGGGGFNQAFADSEVFRKGATGTSNNAAHDTSLAYHITEFGLPPTLSNRSAAARSWLKAMKQTLAGPGYAAVDSVFISPSPDTLDAMPWLIVRVFQDTTSYSFSGTTGIDSVVVGMQWSPDGVNWYAVGGTPTRGFHTTGLGGTGIVADDGIVTPVLCAAEAAAGQDVATVTLECQPAIYAGGNYIVNRTACMVDGWVRFLVGVLDGSGQFAVKIATWKD